MFSDYSDGILCDVKCPIDGNNYDAFCGCVDGNHCITPDKGGTLHHKNANQIMIHNLYESEINNIINQSQSQKNDKFITLIFTGHVTCTTGNNSHNNSCGLRGLAFSKESIALVCTGNICNKESNVYFYEVFDTIHEIGHLFYTPDHYDTLSSGDPNCIYGDNRTTCNNIFCSSCKECVDENASRYDYD